MPPKNKRKQISCMACIVSNEFNVDIDLKAVNAEYPLTFCKGHFYEYAALWKKKQKRRMALKHGTKH